MSKSSNQQLVSSPLGYPRRRPDEIRALRELARRQAGQLSTISRLAYNARMALLDHDLALLRAILDEMAGDLDPDPRQLELPLDGRSPRTEREGHRP